jgi:hypothetical protein
VFFGGVPLGPQQRRLARGVDVLVATPGRLLDLSDSGSLALSGDGNNTPFLLIPLALVILSTYFMLSFELFLSEIITAFASFFAHVYLDNQYHTSRSALLRFAWFRRNQQLHFVHHTYGDSNFALIDNFWDKLLGTYRNPDADSVESGTSIPATDRRLPVSPRRNDLPCTPSGSNASGKSLHRYGRGGQRWTEADRSSALPLRERPQRSAERMKQGDRTMSREHYLELFI